MSKLINKKKKQIWIALFTTKNYSLNLNLLNFFSFFFVRLVMELYFNVVLNRHISVFLVCQKKRNGLVSNEIYF